jgi:GNAT superfamily N-acetyltransferase
VNPRTTRSSFKGIAVEANLWRHGIGSALLAEFERRVRDRGYSRIGLGSAGGYVDAFYEKNGYRRPAPSRRPRSFAKDLRA